MQKFEVFLHRNQMKIFNDPAQVRVVNSGRGFGKSVLLLQSAIYFCLTYNEPINPASPQVAMICMQTLKMAKQIYFKPLLNLLENCPLVESINKSDYRVTFRGDLPDLILRGADQQGERLRGLNLCFAGLDEYQGFDRGVWSDILDPALSRNMHWKAIIIGTPKGKLNVLYDMHLQAIANEGWSYYHFVTADNPFFPKHHIERAKRELPGRVYRAELCASFEEFEGQIATEADKARHLRPTAIAATEAIYIAIDPGVINPAIVLFGVDKVSYRFTVYDSFYKNTGNPYTTDDVVRLTAELIAKHDRPIKRLFIPDDRADLVKTFRNAGYSTAVLVKRNNPGPLPRAEIMNTLFKCDRLFFSDNQEEFFDEVLSYHRETKDGVVQETIEKGQVAHRIDAMLYGICRLAMDYPILLPVPTKLLPAA